MSVVTRGLGGNNTVARGFGGGVSTPSAPTINPGALDSRPLLYPPIVLLPDQTSGMPRVLVPTTVYLPKVNVGINVPVLLSPATLLTPVAYQITPVGFPRVDVQVTVHAPTLLTTVGAGLSTVLNPATLYQRTVAVFSFVGTPTVSVAALMFAPSLSGTFTMVMPAIQQTLAALEPYIYFDQFIGMPVLASDVLTFVPNLAVGDLLDYIYMTLGIAQDTDIALGIVQSMLAAVGLRQAEEKVVTVETLPTTQVVTDMLVEFKVGIAQSELASVGIRQLVSVESGVAQEVAELLTQTLDY